MVAFFCTREKKKTKTKKKLYGKHETREKREEIKFLHENSFFTFVLFAPRSDCVGLEIDELNKILCFRVRNFHFLTAILRVINPTLLPGFHS